MSELSIGLATVRVAGESSRAVMTRHGKTFRMASRLLSARDAAAIFDLYAFCRYLDDLVDEQRGPSREAELEAVARELAAGRSTRPHVAAFIRRAAAVKLPMELPHLLIEGMRSDLELVEFESEDRLVRYAYLVAGSVGLMFCHLVGVPDRRAQPFAIDLGIGMQLTNIARDVLEDAKRGRVYLPHDWLGGPISAERLADPDPETRVRVAAAVERTVALARRYYASADAGMAWLPYRARLAALSASRCYERIGLELVRAGTQWERGRHRVTPLRRAGVVATALLAQCGGTRFHGRPHDPFLHRALHGLPGVRIPGRA